jgi:hypothetical protein
LFGRVNNTSSSFINNGNEQYYPGQKNFTTNVVEDLFDIFDVKGFILFTHFLNLIQIHL